MATAAPLRAIDLTVTRGPLTVLDGVDLVVAAGQRIGLVGPNGVGKTTLLRALAGLEPLDRGRVLRTPPTASVGYLPQEPARSATETVGQSLARRT
nr:ABC-F family ATP-binding cassette domain-containing protein [Acidimicrobiia bacterium]